MFFDEERKKLIARFLLMLAIKGRNITEPFSCNEIPQEFQNRMNISIFVDKSLS